MRLRKSASFNVKHLRYHEFQIEKKNVKQKMKLSGHFVFVVFCLFWCLLSTKFARSDHNITVDVWLCVRLFNCMRVLLYIAAVFAFNQIHNYHENECKAYTRVLCPNKIPLSLSYTARRQQQRRRQLCVLTTHNAIRCITY